jgi:penicillin-binding protein 1A
VWFLFGFVGFTALAGTAWVVTQIPLPSEAPLAETTLIFDASGQQIAELHGVENRYPVKLEQVPVVTQAAVIAAEDRNFLEHRGVDPWSVMRATWADIRQKGATQGGSTITQQYVKNQIVGSDRTLVRKLKEAVVSVKLERKYSKQEILEKYLNTVYFGRGAYGIQAAAKTYFNHDVSELDLKESAYLAGLIRTPSAGDVFTDPESAYYLRTSVLRNMVEGGAISQVDADAVENIKIETYVFRPERADTTFTNVADGAEYFIDYVRRVLVDQYGEDRVLRGGLRVYTTLDPKVQSMAYHAVYDTLKKPDDPIGALVSLDPEGRVVAMVGNRNWAQSQVNVAVGAYGGGGGRQGGSAFKPFVLAEAIRQGIPVDTKYYPAPPEIGPLPGWEQEVHNYGDASFGSINLVEATVNSVNTVYAQLVGEVGPQNVVRMAKDLGITSELKPVPSITLGTQEVSVLEMANAYLTLYNNGMRSDARVIAKVTEGGSVLVDDKPANRKRAIPREVAEQVKAVLTEVVDRGTGVFAQVPRSDVWGKTGTTDGYGDAWFVGANEKLVTAVWMGYEEGQSKPLEYIAGFNRVSGGTVPALIFREFMNEAAPGEGKKTPLPPVDVRSLNATTGVTTGRGTSGAASAATAVEEEPVVTTTTTLATSQVQSTTTLPGTTPSPDPATASTPTTVAEEPSPPPTVLTAPSIPSSPSTTRFSIPDFDTSRRNNP